MIVLGERPLAIADVLAVARRPVGARPLGLKLGDAARARMIASRAVIETALSENRVIYGVTTGFGELKDRRIPQDQVRTLQVNLLRSHAAGVGPPAPRGRALVLPESPPRTLNRRA